GFSTEFYFYVNYGWSQIATQYKWLENDLKEATKPENRALRPWIITYGHRPMYCSTEDDDDCTHKESIVRFDGISDSMCMQNKFFLTQKIDPQRNPNCACIWA